MSHSSDSKEHGSGCPKFRRVYFYFATTALAVVGMSPLLQTVSFLFTFYLCLRIFHYFKQKYLDGFWKPLSHIFARRS